MFDFFRKHTRMLQFLLVLLIFPSFVFFGIQGYSGFMGNDNATVAKVAGQKISRTEWDAAQRDQIERVLHQVGGNKTAAAHELGISRRSLYRWIDRLNIQ